MTACHLHSRVAPNKCSVCTQCFAHKTLVVHTIDRKGTIYTEIIVQKKARMKSIGLTEIVRIISTSFICEFNDTSGLSSVYCQMNFKLKKYICTTSLTPIINFN